MKLKRALSYVVCVVVLPLWSVGCRTVIDADWCEDAGAADCGSCPGDAADCDMDELWFSPTSTRGSEDASFERVSCGNGDLMDAYKTGWASAGCVLDSTE